MNPHEQQLVLDQLTSSEAHLLKLVDGLTPAQWHFREAPERWSISENIEHLLSFESFIMQAIAKTLAGPAEPEKKPLAIIKELLVLGLANARSVKFKAREVVCPTGKWSDPTEMLAELQKARSQTIAFAQNTQVNLRDRFFPHIAFGDLDCYQWLLVLGQHTARHALQIEQVKADPAYPVA